MSKDFEFALAKDEDLEIGEHKWYGREDRTEETKFQDRGTGEVVVIRLFEYKFPPTLEILPTEEQILTPAYLRDLNTLLWGDALRLVTKPRVEIQKSGCRIFAPCVARTGQSFTESPKSIQEWITQK